jgi:hypothetical protein
MIDKRTTEREVEEGGSAPRCGRSCNNVSCQMEPRVTAINLKQGVRSPVLDFYPISPEYEEQR